MWIIISRENEISSYWSNRLENARIEVLSKFNIEEIDESKFIRVSQFFNLEKDEMRLPDFSKHSFLRFYFFQSPMKVLGQLKKLGVKDNVQIFFGYGISSILIVSDSKQKIDTLIQEVSEVHISYEEWEIRDNKLQEPVIDPATRVQESSIKFNDFSPLPDSDKNIFEELFLSLNLFATKVAVIPKPNLFKIEKINREVNSLIDKVVKYQKLIDSELDSIKDIEKIESLNPQELEELKTRIEKNIKHNYHKNQYIDRAIQLISIISYVSTQTFSGVIPVLSRRSLIRRHSLGGIGSCVLALNRITDFIEQIFHDYNFSEKITKDFKKPNTFLQDIENPHKYSIKKWKHSNIDEINWPKVNGTNLFKLPYFSARLGFRESEYAISAAIQSITSGSDREWSIMTITHELMHSQVRQLLNLILAGDLSELDDKDKEEFYDTFKRISTDGFEDEDSLLDSIRYILLTHCCLADKYGSLTVTKRVMVAGNLNYSIPADYKSMFKLLMYNFRSINEIFVHVFDLNYIYRGQIDFYLKSIWHSWSSLPHIDADIRQYVLRCLIVISTKVTANDPFKRFEESVSILKNSLVKLHAEIKKPLIGRIIIMLNNIEEFEKDYYGGFYSYLVLVDMINSVFISDKISAKLYKDDYVRLLDDNEKEELDYTYDLPDEFHNVEIGSPVAFLLNRIRNIHSDNTTDYARETCKLMLSII